MSLRPRARYVRCVGFTLGLSTLALARQLLSEDRDALHGHTRQWARGIAKRAKMKVDAYGTWRLDPAGTYVLMANHQSLLDVPALFNALPMVPGFLAKAELRRVPAFGRAMEMGGHVFVDRGKHERAIEAVAAAAQDLRRGGGTLVIFPEGTRSPRREVLRFKKGGFHLAMQAEVPIVPIGIRGTGEAVPKGSFEAHPAFAEIHVGEPIDPSEFKSLPLEDLVARVRDEVATLANLPLA